MTLEELLNATPSAVGAASAFQGALRTRDVSSVTYDSRRVQAGSVFVAMRGEHANGQQFATDAIARGAIAIVSESQGTSGGIPWIPVRNARVALAELAAAFYQHPSHHLQVVGITGTNGKTTTSYLMASVFEAAGVGCGRVGTVGYRVAGQERPAPRTTPEAPDLQALLREMVDSGSGAAVMEVSSHALALHRVDGIRFVAAVFTNLTRDHLDYHGNMESYFEAKRRLFETLPSGAIAAINTDDPRAHALTAIVQRPVTYGIDRPADVTPHAIQMSIDGLTFEVKTPRGSIRMRSKLVGRPNVYNALAATATAVGLDLPLGAIEHGIANLQHVPGRFQIASSPDDDIRVVVDYAHTDDALRNLLETARPLATGRVITVFGAGGDRDRTKRPLMGAVAARLSDIVVLTSDNPRSEDPERIIDEIRRGIPQPSPTNSKTAAAGVPQVITTPDRRAAIDRAVRDAKPGDLVLVAGKGHERTQTIGARVVPFDDVEVARDALARRRAAQRVSS